MRTFLIASLMCGAAAAQQADPDAVRIHEIGREQYVGVVRLQRFGDIAVGFEREPELCVGGRVVGVQLNERGAVALVFLIRGGGKYSIDRAIGREL